jgi:hypothetical protein
MKLVVRLDAGAMHGWLLSLLERLSASGDIEPVVEWVPGGDIDRVLALLRAEGILRGRPAGAPLQHIAEQRFDPWRGTHAGAPDVTLDLSSGDGPAARTPAGRCWRLTFDGEPGARALIAAAIAGRTPLAAIGEGDATVAAARLGTDRGEGLQSVIDDMLERTITLIVATLKGHRPMPSPLPDDAAPPPLDPGAIGGLAMRRIAKGLARGALGAVYRSLYWAPHWRVGWRRLRGPDLFDLKRHPDEGWIDLPDDGTRFYADPFAIEHDGRLTLFVEDFVHTVGRGVISAVVFGADGPEGRPEPVLELPEHLSYPFVFAADGDVWMVPECCASGRIDLFRATDFPGGWVRDRTLVGDVVASDATLLPHGGLWWMFATVQDGGGFSDALHLWSAPDFRGPWSPHPANPVLIDIASARPAGAMTHRDGALYRPVQDCRLGYGKALGLARVLRLDSEGFEQKVEAILQAGGPLWPGRRIHTLNSCSGFEFIDGSRDTRRYLRR